jgi:hypothetical protein
MLTLRLKAAWKARAVMGRPRSLSDVGHPSGSRRTLEALLLVRCQLVGTRPPPRLRHMWLADCTSVDIPVAQVEWGSGVFDKRDRG